LPSPATTILGGLWAEAFAEEVFGRGFARDLTIVTGHDRDQRVDRLGNIVIVNGGTVGAGGIFDAGRESIGLAELHFASKRAKLRSVDLIAIEPFSGQALGIKGRHQRHVRRGGTLQLRAAGALGFDAHPGCCHRRHRLDPPRRVAGRIPQRGNRTFSRLAFFVGHSAAPLAQPRHIASLTVIRIEAHGGSGRRE